MMEKGGDCYYSEEEDVSWLDEEHYYLEYEANYYNYQYLFHMLRLFHFLCVQDVLAPLERKPMSTTPMAMVVNVL